MKITDIDIHRVTLQYDEARAYELIHYHDLTQRTIYVVRTDSGLPGLGESEGVEKQAVLHGGGFNHRFSLSDAILIKDNHIAAAVLGDRRGHRSGEQGP